LKQVTDILLRPRPEARRRAGAGSADNGRHEGQAVTALEGPPSYEKEMADLERVRGVLGKMLSAESYERAKRRIAEKYGKSLKRAAEPPGPG